MPAAVPYRCHVSSVLVNASNVLSFIVVKASSQRSTSIRKASSSSLLWYSFAPVRKKVNSLSRLLAILEKAGIRSRLVASGAGCPALSAGRRPGHSNRHPHCWAWGARVGGPGRLFRQHPGAAHRCFRRSLHFELRILFQFAPGLPLCYRQMLFSEYAVRFCTVTLLFSASNCISVGGPFRIKKVVEATCTPSSTNTSRVDRSTKT
jgi:hypothetical protein